MQRMAAFLHQNMAVMLTTLADQANQVHVTTLPDLSASLPTFNGDSTPTFKHWIGELERTQRLARWEDPTLLAIAQKKLRGVAADWHASTGRQLTTWTIWKAGVKEQFGEQLSLIQWQQKVTALTQKPGNSLQQYAFAKLKIMSRCPVPITDKERIEYLVQGIRDDQIATSIAVHRPRTVDDFLNIVSEVIRTIDHSRPPARTPTFPKPARDGRLSASGSITHFNSTPAAEDQTSTQDPAESAAERPIVLWTELNSTAHPTNQRPQRHRTQLKGLHGVGSMEATWDLNASSKPTLRDLTLLGSLDELRELAGNRNVGLPLEEVLRLLQESKSRKDIEDIERATRDQAKSSLWMRHGVGVAALQTVEARPVFRAAVWHSLETAPPVLLHPQSRIGVEGYAGRRERVLEIALWGVGRIIHDDNAYLGALLRRRDTGSGRDRADHGRRHHNGKETATLFWNTRG
ncbi:hypothetical protein HPB47_007424 [Ixodes persulcatus]|uniref:Uncharacterized protein n=1 Tax=Ixodes persulcatus TaxID=34615 RepID=A0AC60P7W4_IXOPE|nr:hypothetical protein HPB47_007424 [Ixodes persulcatus]